MNINGVSGFLATIANNFQQHYLNLSRSGAAGRTPDHYFGRGGAVTTGYDNYSESSRSTRVTSPIDTYQRSTPVDQPVKPTELKKEQLPQDKALTDNSRRTQTPRSDCAEGSGQCGNENAQASPVQKQPDGTYQFLRKAELEYSLELRFNLGAITQTVQSIADGDVSSVDEFAAAGFGLAANLNLEGSQEVKSTDVEGLERGRNRQWSSGVTKQSGGMSYRNRNVGLDSFYSEATKIRRSLDETVRDSHRRAVNRLALRYQFDNKFSMSFLNRFNVQTKQVAEQASEAVGQYAETAGEVATRGSSDMMAGFFDAVDGYLNSAEAHLVDKVGSLFDQAAAELGFSEAEAAMARDHLTETITSFFSRVDQALATVETQFTAPVTQPQAQMLSQYHTPAMAETSQQIAVA